MAPPVESMSWSQWARSVEPWVLPAIAAVLVSGMLLLSALVGMFWLAARPAQQPVVIWMQPTTAQTAELPESPCQLKNLVAENNADACAN